MFHNQPPKGLASQLLPDTKLPTCPVSIKFHPLTSISSRLAPGMHDQRCQVPSPCVAGSCTASLWCGGGFHSRHVQGILKPDEPSRAGLRFPSLHCKMLVFFSHLHDQSGLNLILRACSPWTQRLVLVPSRKQHTFPKQSPMYYCNSLMLIAWIHLLRRLAHGFNLEYNKSSSPVFPCSTVSSFSSSHSIHLSFFFYFLQKSFFFLFLSPLLSIFQNAFHCCYSPCSRRRCAGQPYW